MQPTLDLLGFEVRTYAIFLALAFGVGLLVRKAEMRRLGWAGDERHRGVGLGALLGAVVGSKVGLLLFASPAQVGASVQNMINLDFTGRTVVGALIGGYLGVEIAKKIVGIRHSTGDAFAIAIPLGQSLGRLGCFFNGCCYGAPASVPWAITMHGQPRHPVQLYEAAFDLALAGLLWSRRHRPAPRGELFRTYIVAYATIRFGMEFLRGDPSVMVGPFSAVQWVCMAAAAVFATVVVRARRVTAA